MKLGLFSACHDISDGGMLVAIAEMCLAQGIGCELRLLNKDDLVAYLFGEDQARYLVSVPEHLSDEFLLAANQAEIPVTNLGTTGGDNLIIDGLTRIPISHLKDAHAMWMPGYME